MKEDLSEHTITTARPKSHGPPRLESLEDVAVFRRVVEAGSVGLAARALGRSAKWVSRRLSRLEYSTGAVLLRRTTRSQAITEAGRILYDRSGRLLALANDTAAALDVDERQVRGRLVVSMPSDIAYFGGADAVGHWLEYHSGASLDLRIDGAGPSLSRVAGATSTLQIVTDPPREGAAQVERLGSVTWCLAADPSYLYEAGVPVTPSDLVEHQCLCRDSATAQPPGWPLEHVASGELIRAPVRGPLASDNTAALMSALYSGMGIGCVPTWWWNRDRLALLPDAPLERVLPGWRVVPAEVFAVYGPSDATRPLARSFLASVREFLAAWRSPARLGARLGA